MFCGGENSEIAGKIWTKVLKSWSRQGSLGNKPQQLSGGAVLCPQHCLTRTEFARHSSHLQTFLWLNSLGKWHHVLPSCAFVGFQLQKRAMFLLETLWPCVCKLTHHRAWQHCKIMAPTGRISMRILSVPGVSGSDPAPTKCTKRVPLYTNLFH